MCLSFLTVRNFQLRKKKKHLGALKYLKGFQVKKKFIRPLV